MSDRHGPSTNARLQPGTQTHLDRPFRREDFHVAIICALALEYDAVSLAVDHFWDEGDGGDIFGRAVGDNNTYRTGRMGKHDVVLTLLPGMGKASAAASTANMKASFPNLRIALLVGVCGGVPIINISGEAPVEGANPNMLFLGDVVVSKMIIQYDFGRQYPGGFSHKSDRDAAAGAIRPLSKDVQNLLLCNLETEHGKSLLRRKTAEYLRSLQHMAVSREHERSYLFPGPARDKLFPNDYRHKHRLLDDSRCEACAAGTEAICERAIKTSCAELGCNEEMLVYRKSSQTSSAGLKRKRLHVQDSEGSLFPQIFTGCIASGDTVMKSGELRDQLAQKHGVIAFEMEGAGVWDEIPCLIVKGVCDYADSHKSKAWQPYAAATATAAAKAILEQLPVTDKPTAPSENQQREIQAGIVLRQLDQTIGRMDVETLLSWISGLPMKQHPFIFPILHTDPMFDWIFHNADYKTWTSSTPPGIFWISGPFRRVDPRLLVPSYIASIQATTVTTPSDVLSHLVCRPGHDGVRGIILSILKLSTSHMGPQARANVIKMLLHHLVQVAQQHVLQNGWGSRFAEGIREKQQISMLLLESPLELLTATFKEALGHEPLQSTLSILIDTFDNSEASGIDENLFRTLGSLAQWFSTAALNVRIVVTSPVFAGRERILKDVPVIMHDIERMECLRSLEFNNTRYDKITQQSRGSCEWIWQHCEYKAWRASDTSKVLYIQGKPGSGKSTLTKFFSSELASREHAVVANYFYSYREGEVQRSHRNMLRKILYDILNQDESFFYFHFQNEYRSRRQYGTVTEWDYEALKRILSSLSGHPHSKLIFMVIDAVDESDDEDRRIILGLLFELCASSCQCTFKIFIASRPVKQLDVRNKESYRFIRMQDQTKEDIERFARSFLQNLQISNIVEDAAEYIVDNAHGVFLWVSLIGKELLTWVEDGLSEEEIYECLTYLPTELQELYERMFRNLESTSRNPRDRLYRRRMIQLVLFSRRPLDVQELLHAIAIADNIDESFIPSKKSFIQRISTEHRVLSCAGNFLEIKMEKGEDETSCLLRVLVLQIRILNHGANKNPMHCGRKGDSPGHSSNSSRVFPSPERLFRLIFF
ncbi:hypothetical protein QBC36DRAFT_68131 [Triangularia setosa]|uniref:NACHT domain-containing protein n=1 Tax=Triangularia setosa TaxID=2587417 RepID=A0AAN6W0X6_9PEZI|nr:hypothetical protein QBC36DRAFT_68131 [Podospora setosa]